MKKPYIIANWKMNLDLSSVERWFSRFSMETEQLEQLRVIVCPSFPFLEHVRSLIGQKPISLGAQNLFWEEKGPYTGEVSARQLSEAGCRYVIIGHSERRQLFNETDEMVKQKIKTALRGDLQPIVCLGENYQEKEAGQTKKIIEEKLRAYFAELRSYEMKKIVIAYEPVWAISTSPENPGDVANSPESAQVIHKFIKRVIAGLFDQHMAEAVPVIYGGSVNQDDVAAFAAMDDIDGVLVGGASKEADAFMRIINAYIN